MDVGKLLANRRKELDLTLHDVAEYVGVTDSTILDGKPETSKT